MDNKKEYLDTDIFFEMAYDLMCIAGLDGYFKKLNSAWEHVLGYTREELMSKPYIEFVHPDDLSKTLDLANDMNDLQHKSDFENRYICKDGSYKWLAWGRARVIDGYIYNVVRDITLQKQKEIELQTKDAIIENKKEFEFLSDAIPQILWTAKPDGNLDYYNKNWYEYTGMTFEQTKDWGWKPVLHPDDQQNCIDVWTESVISGKPYQVEYRFKRASDQSYRWHLGRALPMRNEKGEIVKWFGSCTDIEDQKAAIAAASEAQNRLQSVMSSVPVVLWAMDKDGIITLAEGKQLLVLRDRIGTIVGKSHFEIYKNNPHVISNAKKALQGEAFVDIVEVNGIIFDTTYIPIKNEAGETTGMVGIAHDITERKNAETANQFKSRFLASMSHEIRTPLNAIIGFSQILQKQYLSREQHNEYLNHIISSGNVLLKLIGDILDLNKIEEGKLYISNESFNLKEVISSSLYPYKFKANEKGLNFSLQFDQFLPENVIGDSDRIKQVLINLIGNALKFTEQGEISVSISNAGERTLNQASILFLVTDTGIGIAPEKQKDIFESFTQADNSISRKYGGSGLGLTIVKQLVDAMGGEIKVTSPVPNQGKEGKGTTFWFTLPLKIDQTVKHHIPEEHLSKVLQFDKKVKVLIAEDNKLNQALANLVLSNIGCEATFANNGEEAVDLFRKDPGYDIILMDVNMPVMNGYEATRIIRHELKSNIPVIGLTANVYKEDIESCLNAGMNGHLGKPYTEYQLFTAMEKWLNATIQSKAVEEKCTNLDFIKGLIKNDSETLKQLLLGFLKQKETFMETIDVAVQEKRWKDIAFMVHTIKSSVKMVGLDRIIPQIISVEKKADNYKGLDDIPSLLDEIKQALNQSAIELEKEIELL